MCAKQIPAWVGITYLIYVISMEITLFGGTGYAVFVLGHTGWWFVPATLISSMIYRPGRWSEMITGDTGPASVQEWPRAACRAPN